MDVYILFKNFSSYLAKKRTPALHRSTRNKRYSLSDPKRNAEMHSVGGMLRYCWS